MKILDDLVVATDCEEVADVCRREGARVVMTSAAHPSGSDRAWEAARRMGSGFDVVVNVQGDEPLVAAEAVEGAVAMARAGFDVGTCAAPLSSRDELDDPSVVKVARTGEGRALYFSRSPVPFRLAGFGPEHDWSSGPHLRHVGVYAFQRRALERWASLDPSPLEAEEGLEQLRALENGMSIGVALVASAAGGVDTPEDLEAMEDRLRTSAPA